MTIRVGLTGGIGSGKSTVSSLLSQLGAVIVDYDKLARTVVEPGQPALAAIVQRFGRQILTSDGALNRPTLGSIVFGDPQARRDLEKITHPAIKAAAAAVEAQAPAGAIVVHDNPLLVEMGGAEFCDLVLVVDLDTETQIDRLMSSRGMSRDEALARISAQTSREARVAVADRVIDNSVSREELTAAVVGWWNEISSAPPKE